MMVKIKNEWALSLERLKRKSKMTDIQQEVLDRLELYIEVLDYVCKTYQLPQMIRQGITEYNGPMANKDETLALITKAKMSGKV